VNLCGLSVPIPFDLPDVGEGACCLGAAGMGPERCTCWQPVYDLDQTDPDPTAVKLLAAGVQPVTRSAPCHDCAYRPGSPERRGEDGYAGDQDLLDRIVQGRAVFEAIHVPLHDRSGSITARTLIDLGDAPLAEHRWYLDSTGYAVRTQRLGPGKRRKLLLHREILGLSLGDPSVDHVSGDKLDNRRTNLRVGGQALNLQNRKPTAGHPWARGVSYRKDRRKWQAYVKLDGKTHHLGNFDDPRAAAETASRFRADRMPWSLDARLLDGVTPFWCHQGMRKLVAWRHPAGVTVPVTVDGYGPPGVDGVPYRADGTPAEVCGGWAARRRALEVSSAGGGS